MVNVPESVQSLYFSPTGTTKKILSTIEANTRLQAKTPIDLTLTKQRDSFSGKVEGDLLLVGIPVYHGSIPWPMLAPLNKLQGEDRWAVLVAVYGNREAETCVDEMAKILRGRGFKILAGANFIAEHSWSTTIHPIAVGRPEASDLAKAAEFGNKVAEKLSKGPSEIKTSDLLHNFFTKQMVEGFPDGYHKKAVGMLRRLGWVEFSKDVECSQCGSCSSVCPTGAMNVELRKVDDDLCIKCMACTRACPLGVISLHYADSPEAVQTFDGLMKVFAVRKEPVFFI